MEMVNVVGVQFRRAGKIYDFTSGEFSLRIGDPVVVDTDRGPSLAEVARIGFIDRTRFKEGKLKPILRKASKKDTQSEGKLTTSQVESITRQSITELKLDMRVLSAEIQFGGNKAIIYFTAPGRVDFRELVKRLAGALKTRIELKQVGARDETKLLGGVGICGREYCCSSFLREFVPVSIKMAKNQNLALNPSKVSGGCGRLLCCLTYEDTIYDELRQTMLPKGTRVKLIDGSYGDVVSGDFLNQVCIVETDTGQEVKIAVNQLEVVERKAGMSDSDWGEDIDIDALEALSDDQGGSHTSLDIEPGDEGGQRDSYRNDQQGQRSRGNDQQRPRHQRDQGGDNRGSRPKGPKGPRGPGKPGRRGGSDRGS